MDQEGILSPTGPTGILAGLDFLSGGAVRPQSTSQSSTGAIYTQGVKLSRAAIDPMVIWAGIGVVAFYLFSRGRK